MGEGRGLRAGMSVRDGAGNTLGKVRRVYPWGFSVVRGFWQPREWVFRHDEVAQVGDDVVQVARRPDDLMRLAAGELPESWSRQRSRFGGDSVPSSPAEARGGTPPLATGEEAGAGGEREFVRTRGQPAAPAADARARSHS